MGNSVVRSLFNHTLTSWFRFGLSTLVVFFLTPVMVKELGIDDFGLWTLIFSLIGFFELLDFGLFNATVKYISQFAVTKDHEKRNGMLSTFLFSFILLSCFGALFLSVIAYFFYEFFNIPEQQLLKALFVLLIIGARTLLFGLPLSLFKGILFGHQKITLINGVSSMTTLLYWIVAWFVLVNGGGIIALAWVNLLQLVIEHLTYVVSTYFILEDVSFSWKLVDRKHLKEISSFSMMQIIGGASSMLTIRADPIIIQFFLPLYFVGLYAIPLKIVTYLYMFIKQFTNLLGPLIVRFHIKDEKEKIKRLYLYSLKATFAFGGVLILGGILFGTDFMRLWVGQSFLKVSYVLDILVISLGVNLFQIIACQILAMVDRHVQLIPIFITMAAVNICASLVLIFPFGMNGVALGTLVSAFVGAIMSTKPMMRVYSISYRELVYFGVAPCVIPVLVSYICYYIFIPEIHSMGQLFSFSFVIASIYSVSYLALLNTFERKEFFSLLRRSY